MQQRSPLISAFAGEDRWNRDLPPNVAKDGLNCDYSRGSLRRRDGIVRLHADRIQDGGVEVLNSASLAAVVIPHNAAYEFSGGFTVGLSVVLTDANQAGTNVLDCFDTANNTGFRMWAAPGSDDLLYWGFLIGTGAALIEVTNEVELLRARANSVTHIECVYSPTDGKAYLSVKKPGGIGARVNAVCAAYTHSGLDWSIGNTSPTAATTQGVIVDELRVWDEEKTTAFLSDIRGRELTDDEVADDALVGYWKFNDAGPNVYRATDSSATNNAGLFVPTAPPTLVASLIPYYLGLNGAAQLAGDLSYMFIPYSTAWVDVWANGWFGFEMWCRLDAAHVSEAVIAQVGTHDEPLCTIKFDGTTNDVEVEFKRASIALQTFDTTYTATVGKPFNITVMSFGTWIEIIVWDADGVTRTVPYAGVLGLGPGDPAPADADLGIYIGCRYQAAGPTFDRYAPITVDDIRLWNIMPGYDYIEQWWDRELTGWDANLVGYWKLNSNNYLLDEVGNSNIDGSTTTVLPRWTRACVANRETTPILGLVSMVEADGSGDVLAVTASSAYSFHNAGAAHLAALDDISPARRNHARYRDVAVFTDKEGQPYRYDGSTRPYALTPPEIDATDVTVAAGSNTGLTGDFKYRFQYVCTRGDVRGPIGLVEKSITGLSDEDVDIASIPGSSDPQVDRIYIYRTHDGGVLYYYLDEVVNPGAGATTTYTDDTADVNLVELADPYLGVAPPAKFAFVHKNTLFLGNSPGAETRLIASEVGYYERFYYENDIWFGRGDGDELTGAISIGHRALVTKRNSLWLLDGPPYQAIQVWSGSGCISHGTLQAGGAGIYMLSAAGAMVWNGEASAQPQKLGGNSQKPLWDLIDQSRAAYAVGCYYPPTREYWLSFDTTGGDRITLVWNEERGTWAKFDAPIEAYAVAPLEGGELALVGAWRGYVVELRRGTTDGVSVNGTTPTVTFAVTGGGPQYVDVASGLSVVGSGLAGVTVGLVKADGTLQERVVYHNTATRLWVSEPWDEEPDGLGSWTLRLGAIRWYWDGPHLRFGDEAWQVAVRRLKAVTEAQGQSVNVLVEHWGDGEAGASEYLALV